MNPVLPNDEIGRLLYDSGCRQGAVLSMLNRERLMDQDVIVMGSGPPITDSLELVAISQDCDISARYSTESTVEFIAAQWNVDPALTSIAKKGNSARTYLLKEEAGRALVADARWRYWVDKHALLDHGFKEVLTDRQDRLRFARWLGNRYNRPALPDVIVETVQRPIVAAVDRAMRKATRIRQLLERIEEVRFSADGARDMTVSFLLMLAETAFSPEEEAEVTSWLYDCVVKEGRVSRIDVYFGTADTVVLSDYLNTTQLALDHMSDVATRPSRLDPSPIDYSIVSDLHQ